MWTEIIANSLRNNGHHVDSCYHNRKTLLDRAVLAGVSFRHGAQRRAAWKHRHRLQLLKEMSHSRWDVLLSIQGTIDQHTVKQLRQYSPHLKIIYWWGDILTEQAQRRLEAAADFSDRLLLSYLGSYETLKPVYGDRLIYFPFAASRGFHSVGSLSAQDRKRFTSAVAFVGSYYPERCALLRYLNKQLDTPVSVWGRGWRKCGGIRHHGALSLADSLKVYSCSRISLNLHHVDTPNGCNMKFYEIPAAGGFQVCDWQALMNSTELGRQTVTCRTLPEFSERVKYYLAHEQERRQILQQNSDTVFTTADYETRLAELLQQITADNDC